MIDSLAETLRDSRQAVAVTGGEVCLELAADEFVYPIAPRGSDVKIHARVSPYNPEEVSPWYDSLLTRRKQISKTETALSHAEASEIGKFVDRHFLGLANVELEDGSEPTLEDAKRWLDANPDIKTQIFREGYDLVGAPEEAEESDAKPKRAVLIFSRPNAEIPSQATLVDGDGKTQVIRVTHVLDPLTEDDRQRCRRAVQTVENSKSQQTYTTMDWKVLTDTYDRRAQSLKRALVRGAACALGNKAEWVRLMPFSHKVYVVLQGMRHVDLRNF